MSAETYSEKENPIGDYLLNEELGSGGFAKVVQGIHIPTGEKVAVKIMDKAQIFAEPLNLNRIRREIAILKIVRHKNIIKLYELMETPHKIYLVMEYCNGGELFDYIVSKQHLTERQACRFFQEIIDSLEYLHSLNIVHRDIKPENLLLDTTGQHKSLKLIDFGISNCYNPDKLLNTPCGTASYAPPEMHKGEEYYGLLSDVWSAGVVLYAMVFGYLPFCEDDEDTNISNIISGNYEIPEEASPELADLLIHLLDINPLTRYDLEQIKRHPWFNMARTYISVPGVIEGYHRIPVDMNIIEACEQYGYDRQKVIDSVEKCKYNRDSSVYYILLSKMKREGYKSISDLFSDKFLDYINNPRNIIYRIDDTELFGNDDKDNNNFFKNHSEANINEKIKRHQSHPINDKNIEEELLSFKANDNKRKEKKNNENNENNQNINPADINNSKNDNFETINDNNKSNYKYKTKKNEQKPSFPVYVKPKVKIKKNRNDKAKDFNIHKEIFELKNITINSSNQTNKTKNIINNMNHSTTARRKNNKKKEIKKPNLNIGNNRSFSQNKKNRNKKIKKNNDKNNNINNNNATNINNIRNTNNSNYKSNFPEFKKKPENNALKTEIIRKNLNEKIIPLNSFHILSKTREILNGLNNNEAIDVDFMNTSFTKKLSDDVKEKILKLKNPKKNVPEKQKKINNALLSLKMKKQKKKNNNNAYNYYSTTKPNNKNKSKKIGIKAPIFKDNSRKDHTIIHNRNASLRVEHRNYHKNLGNDNHRHRKDISLSPNMNQDRRNIINIYVQTKNNVNSNNVYNINLITKNNYSIENSSNRKRGSNYNTNNHHHHNNTNIKVKKTKISRQNLKSIDEKLSVNSNQYLNTTNLNSSFLNRNYKYGFQTPNKINQNLYFEKPNKVLSNSIIQYPIMTSNNDLSHIVKKNTGRSQSQNHCQNNNNNGNNNKVKNKPLYNNSFNDFYNKNKKKIRLSFNPIKEKDFENLDISQNVKIDKINSNQKIKKINSSQKNSARVNNKYRYHYKSKSLMDTENPISLKNHLNNMVKNRENNFTNNNKYLLTNNRSMITENKKITKIKSTRCASVKPIDTNTNNNTNYNNSNKLRTKFINISFVNLPKHEHKQALEPRKYNGPIDFKCILVTHSIDLIIEKISNILKRNKISKTIINPYKMKCSKGGENFDLEFFILNNNTIKLKNQTAYNDFNYYNEFSYSHKNDINYKTATARKNNKNLMIYYFTNLPKKGNNKNISKMISKIISSKFSIIKSKK